MKIGLVSPVPPELSFRAEPAITLWDSWDEWKNSTPPGSGEQRDIAMRRMEACIESQLQPLDLSDLVLSSLPPFLPPTSKLIVHSDLLEGLLNHTQLNRSIDEIITDYVDNILLCYFDSFFLRELNADNNHFLGTLFSEEADNIKSVIDRVALEFIAARDTVLANTREGLTRYINYIFANAQNRESVAFKAELAQLLHGNFCEIASRCSIGNVSVSKTSPFGLY